MRSTVVLPAAGAETLCESRFLPLKKEYPAQCGDFKLSV